MTKKPRLVSLQTNWISGDKTPIDILIEQEEQSFACSAYEEVVPANRTGSDAKYGMGDFSTIAEAAEQCRISRQSLYNQHDRALNNILNKKKELGLN